jgi:hypothetical protein
MSREHLRLKVAQRPTIVNMGSDRGQWLVWGCSCGGLMFDGFMQREVGLRDEADYYLQRILKEDPEWPPPDYDDEGLTFRNDSFILIVESANEEEVREEVEYFQPDARGYFRLGPAPY